MKDKMEISRFSKTLYAGYERQNASKSREVIKAPCLAHGWTPAISLRQFYFSVHRRLNETPSVPPPSQPFPRILIVIFGVLLIDIGLYSSVASLRLFSIIFITGRWFRFPRQANYLQKLPRWGVLTLRQYLNKYNKYGLLPSIIPTKAAATSLSFFFFAWRFLRHIFMVMLYNS